MRTQMLQDDKVTIVRLLEDRIDASNASALKSALLDTIDKGQTVMGVDLSLVRFIDSSGLGVLVTAMKRIGQNGTMALWGLNTEIRGLFELTQLYKVFEIFETEPDAMKTLKHHAEA